MELASKLVAGFCAIALVGTSAAFTGAVAQVSDDVVKIGVLGDESGPFSDSGGLGNVFAVETAVADFGGSVLGKPIEVVHADHQNKPDVAVAVARKWFEADHVDTAVGLTLSSVALAVQKLATDFKRTVLITGASSTELTGKACSPYGSHWLEDSYALTAGVIKVVAKAGGKTWFFITLDNAFGTAMLNDGSRMVDQVGGKVVGVVRHPLGQSDLSSFLLQAATSKADYIALANVGLDTTNAVKQAQEFGIGEGAQHLVTFTFFVTDIHAVGLQVAQNLTLPSGFYWDQNESTRAFSNRFLGKFGRMPTNAQALSYAATLHYLKAVRAAGTDETAQVNRKMRELPVDFFGTVGSIRPDGRVTYDITTYRVKTPAESKYPWDYLTAIDVVPGQSAFRPLSESQCPLVMK